MSDMNSLASSTGFTYDPDAGNNLYLDNDLFIEYEPGKMSEERYYELQAAVKTSMIAHDKYKVLVESDPREYEYYLNSQGGTGTNYIQVFVEILDASLNDEEIQSLIRDALSMHKVFSEYQ